MVYDELTTLVAEVNAEVAELTAAETAQTDAQQVLDAAKVVVAEEESQVESKLDALLAAVQARLTELKS